MSKAFDLLKEYGVFYVATVNGGKPAVRPFGAVMEYKGEIHIATANVKDVYKQLKADPCVQLAAWKAGTHDWIRITGKAEERNDKETKQAMLDACPVLKPIFGSADNPVYTTFAVTEAEAVLYTADGAEKL